MGHFEATIHALPPLSWVEIPPEHRLSVGARVLLLSAVLFGISFAMESVLGICAANVQGC